MKQENNQQTEKGIAHIGLIVMAVIVVAAVAFAAWWVWKENKPTEGKTGGTDSSELNNKIANEQPEIPADFVVYSNQNLGFSFAYPEKVGTLTGNEATGQDVLLFASSKSIQDAFSAHTQSPLYVEAYKKEGFVTAAGKYGPILEFDGDKWTVSSKGDGGILNGGYVIGSEYKSEIARTVNGVPIYGLSFTDEGCHRTVWVFQLSKAFVKITLPAICADEIDTIPQDQLATYKEISEKVLNTLTITN